jgi:NAD(P)-dependent dehydrogenase (short-subunit alcohol dehydrogenase family)
VDVLCNNAGVFSGGRMWRCSPEDFEWALRVNLWGVLHGIRAFVPRMIAQNTEGHIVNTCSIASLFARPMVGPYTVSKFAAFAATQCLAQELVSIGSKVKVSALCPDSVATRIHESARNRPSGLAAEKTMDGALADRLATEMVARGTDPEEIVDAVLAALRTGQFLILSPEREALAEMRSQTDALTADDLPTFVPRMQP